MAFLKRNIWTLFTAALCIGSILFCLLLWKAWQVTYERFASAHNTRTNVVAQTIESLLTHEELVLDIMAWRILRQPTSSMQFQEFLDSLIKANPNLAMVGFARPDGSLTVTNSEFLARQHPNLLNSESTRFCLEEAVQARSATLCRPFYLQPLDEWVVPLLKAVRAPNNQLLGVVVAELRLVDILQGFSGENARNLSGAVILFRDQDGYIQFMHGRNVPPETWSQIRVDEQSRSRNLASIMEQLNLSKEAFRSLASAVAFKTEQSGGTYLTSARPIPKFRLWAISQAPLHVVYLSFLRSSAVWGAFFLLAVSALFGLCRSIARFEEEQRNRLSYQATHDDLTKCLNRRGLIEHLENTISNNREFSLLVLNIDNFKNINDRFGESYGDLALKELARLLKGLLSEDDQLGRLMGDEFAIITLNTNLEQLVENCRHAMQTVSSGMQDSPIRTRVTLSAGIALSPDHGSSASELIRAAHLALAEAKKLRGNLVVFAHHMEQAHLRRLQIQHRLSEALLDHQLYMLFQPQVTESGRIFGIEALVRWNDSELGFVSPAEFIQVAERCGMMPDLGQYVLTESLRIFKKLRKLSLQPLSLSVNISNNQLEQPDFAEKVLEIVASHGLPPTEIILEITESVCMSDMQHAVSTLQALRSGGFRISLDDFGTGYSSLSLLQSLPLDELKIDKSFVDSVGGNQQACEMIESIIHIAKAHNLSVVVEGVETADQLGWLCEIGCQFFQGYYFSKPLPEEEIARLVSDAASLPIT
ncbi:MAG: bifunctional diguanylate cyclase/phosphodiesterase [Gammaproteobacteria bacterium]|nr:MAG: bifunctional diguanylate cyclase/phosphodiesterase [Gammaproteobacteria bacterium]